jgi:creatinine amidohydrolase/Fe(II)-dependent formamide hydrolase-like protein
MEANAADREQICAGMALPPENFAAESSRFSAQEQYENCLRLLVHILAQAQSLGFRLAVLVPGHYPLLDHARAACVQFHQMRWSGKRCRMNTWVFCEYELVQDAFPGAGDHAGFWETSLLLALEPELVDVTRIPPDRTKPPVGIVTNQPVQDSSAEIGEKAIRLIVERVGAQVADRLKHPGQYYMHGWRV